MFCHCPISFILPLTTNAILYQPSFPFQTIPNRASTVEPRYNEPLYNEDLGITNDFLYPSNGKYMKKNLDIANKFCQSLDPSLYRGSTAPRKVTTTLASLPPRLHFTISDQVTNTYAELPYQLGNEEGEGGVGGGGGIFLYLGRRQ